MISGTWKLSGFKWIAPLILLLLLPPSLWSNEAGSGFVDGATKTKRKVDTKRLARICNSVGKPTLAANDRRSHAILEKLLGVTSELSLSTPGSAQNAATCWLLFEDPKKMKASNSQFLQRYALAVFWFATDGKGHWQVKTDWMSGKDECSWYGITCGRSWTGTNLVREIDLGFNDCHGIIPRELAILTELEDVDLHGNEIQGVIPFAVCAAWKKVKYLRLHMNGLFGQLPSDISKMSSLREISIFGNYFHGAIPKELEKLAKLERLDLYANNFSGNIPSNLGKMKKLRSLDVHDNDLVGRMPKEICENKSIKSLTSDCLGRSPEVTCECCHYCCAGLPDMLCVDMKTKEVINHIPGGGKSA